MHVRRVGHKYYVYQSNRVGGKIVSTYLGKMEDVIMKCPASEAKGLELARGRIEQAAILKAAQEAKEAAKKKVAA